MRQKRIFFLMSGALVILFVSIAICFTYPVAAAQSETLDDKKVEPVKKDAPKIVSVTVKPSPLTKNDKNKVRLKIKYEDENQDLQGGSLELSIKESNGYNRNLSIPLSNKKYGKSEGKGKEKFFVVIGNCSWARITAKLKDAAGNIGNKKRVKVNAKGESGPPWGTRLKQRAKDFTLVDQNGNEVSLHDYWGKVILLTFGSSG